MHPTEINTADLPLEIRVVMDYAAGISTDKIKEKYEGIRDRKEVTRLIRKGLSPILEKWQVAEAMRRDTDTPDLPQ